MGALDLLPFDQMTSWEDFEKIQWRIMRDVEGLRHAQMYGERGQAQQGLDVVALTPGGSGVALQSKQYKQFGPAQLRAAVNKFRTSSRPFPVERLIIGVSREVKSTKTLTTLRELRSELLPIELDLWDKQALSDLLRGAPRIVIEFFGMPTAERFCLPFEIQPTVVPTENAVAIREALARTPEEVTGASELLRVARETSDDPTRSLQLIEEAQHRLRDAGFESYAVQHEPARANLLAKLGRSDEAARQALDELWSALDRGLTNTAQMTQRRLQGIVGEESVGPSELADVAEIAMDLYFNPLAVLPAAIGLRVGDNADQLRLAVLAGETALANGNLGWLHESCPTLGCVQ
ncbi:hypothetical protein [Nocardia puris]|uniref:hypothetical protein n=1 Tax=Nocardia puris TaxID=208602 RepID=UPI002E1DB87E